MPHQRLRIGREIFWEIFLLFITLEIIILDLFEDPFLSLVYIEVEVVESRCGLFKFQAGLQFLNFGVKLVDSSFLRSGLLCQHFILLLDVSAVLFHFCLKLPLLLLKELIPSLLELLSDFLDLLIMSLLHHKNVDFMWTLKEMLDSLEFILEVLWIAGDLSF